MPVIDHDWQPSFCYTGCVNIGETDLVLPKSVTYSVAFMEWSISPIFIITDHYTSSDMEPLEQEWYNIGCPKSVAHSAAFMERSISPIFIITDHYTSSDMESLEQEWCNTKDWN